MNVEIIDMNHNGEGIGRIDGKVIFVPKVFVGDIVWIKDIVDCGNYFRGKVDYFIKYSDSRVEIKCPYYEKCGGCQMMEVSYESELEYKKNKVINIFKKYCNISINPSIVGSSEYHYRNKVVFQVKDGKIGYFEGSSDFFIEVDRCLLVNDKMNNIISVIRDNVCLDKVEKIMMRYSLNGIMLMFYGEVDDIDVSVFDGVCSIYVNNNLIYGRDTVMLELGVYKFLVSPNSFFQINFEQTFRLYSYVKDNIKSMSSLLDLYCGVGSIGIFCSDKCRSVVGVEINESAVENALANKKLNNIDNISFICLNVNKIKYNIHDFDVVIIDPPRGGLDKKTINIIKKIKSKIVIYISCNPITLARDINFLSSDYMMKDIKLFDMFPKTYHVECVCVLNRL